MSPPAVVRITGNGMDGVAGEDMVAALVALHGTCFAPLPETPWSDTAFRTLLNAPTTHTWVSGAVDGPDRSGLQGLLMVRELAGDWEVLTVCVAPEERRRGVARALFAEFLAAAGDDAHVLLEAAIDNEPAIALYMEFGFQPVGRRTGYYSGAAGGRVDALILGRMRIVSAIEQN